MPRRGCWRWQAPSAPHPLRPHADRSFPMSIKTIHIPAGGGFEHVTVGSTQPVEPGAGEITVRVRASSLNFHDYMVAKGITGPSERRIPMADGAGEVTAVGEGVTEFAG